jgi:uncharacterized protein YggT (Ycf19 family)
VGGTALTIDLILRGVVLAAFTASALVALTHWLVRERRIAPFGAWPRLVRRASDPVLQPLERTLVRQGRNPQDGPFWLMGIVVIAGIALIIVGRWIAGAILTMASATRSGPLGWLRFLLDLGFNLLLLSIIVRVIGSWVGFGRYRKGMRPFYLATDWLIEPIRKRLPQLGMGIDISPLIGYIVVLILRAIVFSLLA